MYTADYHYPDRGCLVDFLAIRSGKIAGMGWGPITLDLSSQSGAFDHSATATSYPLIILIFHPDHINPIGLI